MTLWTVTESTPPTIVRNASSSSANEQSRLEIDGQQAVLLLHFDSTGICGKNSKVLFPTLYANPNDFRGYLTAPFQYPTTHAPANISYDGVALQLDYENAVGFAFVSPYNPIAWAVVNFNSPQRTTESSCEVITTANSHTVYRIRNWVSSTRLEVAHTCERSVSAWSSAEDDIETRRNLVAQWTESFRFECTSKELNAAVYFAKIRTSEAVFNATNLGLVHSPGGAMFYGGVWCNDQAEYAAPLLVLLGDSASAPRAAILNSFRVIANHFDVEKCTIPYSVEIDGGFVGKLDRGDAAMYAWGLALVISALNSAEITREFFEHVEFCCGLMMRKIEASESNIFTSQSDELEGRFTTGNANLSVNCTAILAFEAASEAALVAGKEHLCDTYREQAVRLRKSVHEFFRVEDSFRYAYYEGCEDARGWICLAALAGLQHGTDALKYSLRELWLSDGVVVTEKDDVIWDRCSLYALRAAFQNGLVNEGAARLGEFIESRVLYGKSSPYCVENNRSFAPLSAESALLVRVITEGLLGIQYKSNSVVQMRVVCPDEWKQYSVKHVPFFGSSFDCSVKIVGKQVEATIRWGSTETSVVGRRGMVVEIKLVDCEISVQVRE